MKTDHFPVSLPVITFFTLALFCLTPFCAPPLALLLGVGIGVSLGNPYPERSKAVSGFLLKVCIVLLGFGMDIALVIQAGAQGFVFAATMIAATLLLGALLGRWLGIAPRTALLISAGTAICGGSAIAAVGSVTKAENSEMSIAIGTVFLLNAVGLYLFPVLGHWLHLSQMQFGTWAGVAIHDISSVVGAASGYGAEALQTGIAVKLSRTLWIVPLALAAAWRYGDRSVSGIKVPWFIGLFILASCARSFIPGMESLIPLTSGIALAGLSLTLFLIGAGINMKNLQAVGWPPLLQGVVLWVFVSVTSLAVILTF
ncbi:MAG: hypothetical protein JWO78_847 [Micavibrio sp.]|nr:hypothetical protein [Micavibrio sp.]